MESYFQETAKMMEKAWEPFRKSMGDPNWLPVSDPTSRSRWVPWIKATREACDANMSAWNLLAEQSEEAFFKFFKNTPVCPSSLEGRVKELNQVMRTAGKKHQGLVTSSLDDLAALFQDREEESES